MGGMRVPLVVVLLLGVAGAGCGPTVDLTKGVQLQVVSSGWFDAGIIGGQNKLVPSISFTLKNLSDQKLGTLQVNAVFRRVNEDKDWGSGFVTAADSSGLAPGQTTATLTLRSQLGYTGTESRLEMLKNSHFVDARVDLFAKYASTQWAKMGTYPIDRNLLEK